MTPLITTGDKRVSDIVDEVQRRIAREEAKRKEDARIRRNWQMLQKKGFGLSKKGRPPVILNYEDGRMLCDVMPDGAWKNQRCFIIGGGESLKGFDFSRLKNELVIGVNRAYEMIDCEINYAMDNNIYHWITSGKLGWQAKEKFENFEGFPVWLDSAGYDYPRGIFILKKLKNHRFSHSLKRGIAGGTNAGFGALNLAVCLGANPIYLLGFDMKGRNGKQSWWHDGYPDEQVDRVYGGYIHDFKGIVSELKKEHIRVINLNPESALKCFEFGEFKDIEPIKQPIIISYYTKGTGYEDQVEQLKATLKRFNLENDVVGIPDRGSWHENTYYKPRFILRMMKKHPGRALVFIDADAKIRRNPVLFNGLDCDFGCHFYHGKELLSGTLYFGSTKGARYLINKWVDENKRYPKIHMPQKNLRAVFEREKYKIKWKALPVEYCMIYDSHSRYEINPVIEHFQLSRQYKKKRGKEHKYAMKKDLTEIQEFCRGKRICLLGNANSILDEKKDIDSFDIICRMNRGTPQGKEEFIGRRTDIHFLSTNMSGAHIKLSFNPRFVVWMTVCNRLASPWTLRSAIQNPQKDWQELYEQLNINPTTGLLALSFILKRIDFESLTIYGFDFFATKTWYNTKIDSGQKHSGKKEKILIREMIAGRPNVKLI